MRHWVVCVLAIVCLPSVAVAQPIHGHPQKAFSANTQLGAFYGFTWNGSSWVQQ